MSFGNSVINLCIYIYKKVLKSFWRHWPGNRIMKLKINILTKKGSTNLDIILYYYKFKKITKAILMVVAEENIEIFI